MRRPVPPASHPAPTRNANWPLCARGTLQVHLSGSTVHSVQTKSSSVHLSRKTHPLRAEISWTCDWNVESGWLGATYQTVAGWSEIWQDSGPICANTAYAIKTSSVSLSLCYSDIETPESPKPRTVASYTWHGLVSCQCSASCSRFS